MYGTVISWLVSPPSATAKCCSSDWPNPLTSAPRRAICAVTFWNAVLPEELNPNVTSGSPLLGSVLSSGLVIWLPRSATLSLSTKNWASGLVIGVGCEKLAGTASITTQPRGMVTVCPSEAVTPLGRPESRSLALSSGPLSRQCSPATGTVPWSRAAVAHAALPGAPNIQYWVVMREFVELAQ